MQLFSEIPQQQPSTELLDSLSYPADLRQLEPTSLEQLADELRAFLMYTIGQCGGHFGAGLGVVELTIALHYVFATPYDRLVWDVGHQCYPHKILTGRAALLHSIRQQGGLAPFPSRTESEYDHFGVGHSSTSISAALGMSLADRVNGITDRHTVAIIGDGAMTAGMAFEALNHAGDARPNMLVVLNDNNMSISANVGALSNYFARIFSGYAYTHMREAVKKMLGKTPLLLDISKRTEEHLKGMVVPPSSLFEAFGCNYIGPIDGHHLPTLVATLENLKQVPGLNLLHVKTVKGKGLEAAEADPIGYHALGKLPSANERSSAPKTSKAKYANIFGQWLIDQAEIDQRLVAITPAMREGSDLVQFSQQFPQRYFDVGIAEQHSLTLAAGMACGGAKPVVAIYSTFLQRAYDQLIHDICLQNLDITLAIDRAGLVGEDGATHNGSYDLCYLRPLANIIILAPASGPECRAMLEFAYQHPAPAAVRYPRGSINDCSYQLAPLQLGRAQVLRSSQKPESSAALLVFGTLLNSVIELADEFDCTLVNMRFIKPLDSQLLQQLARSHKILISIEDNCGLGGAGSAVNEALAQQDARVVNLGLPDEPIEHASREQMLTLAGLDPNGLRTTIQQHTVPPE